jgi:hypothetical protein
MIKYLILGWIGKDFRGKNKKCKNNCNGHYSPARFETVGTDKKQERDEIGKNREAEDVDDFSGMNQQIPILTDCQILKSKQKIDQEENYRETEPN